MDENAFVVNGIIKTYQDFCRHYDIKGGLPLMLLDNFAAIKEPGA